MSKIVKSQRKVGMTLEVTKTFEIFRELLLPKNSQNSKEDPTKFEIPKGSILTLVKMDSVWDEYEFENNSKKIRFRNPWAVKEVQNPLYDAKNWKSFYVKIPGISTNTEAISGFKSELEDAKIVIFDEKGVQSGGLFENLGKVKLRLVLESGYHTRMANISYYNEPKNEYQKSLLEESLKDFEVEDVTVISPEILFGGYSMPEWAGFNIKPLEDFKNYKLFYYYGKKVQGPVEDFDCYDYLQGVFKLAKLTIKFGSVVRDTYKKYEEKLLTGENYRYSILIGHIIPKDLTDDSDFIEAIKEYKAPEIVGKLLADGGYKKNDYIKVTKYGQTTVSFKDFDKAKKYWESTPFYGWLVKGFDLQEKTVW